MKEDEKKYMGQIEGIIESLGTIQRNFVLDKTGIRAIIKFIEDLEGRRPFFDLDDPVVQKGKTAAGRVIGELEKQLERLGKISPPASWKEFHRSLVESISLQLEGYKEMFLIFEDSSIEHVTEGQNMVSQGMKILEGGSRKE